jgi:AsmA protein
MRRSNLTSRLTTFLLATVVCLLLAVIGPMLLNPRASDEPFSGYALMASPRDLAFVSSTIRLSSAPDLTLDRGALYADGNATAGMPISRFVLDGAVFHLNASGLRTVASSFASMAGIEVPVGLTPLVEQFSAKAFDALILRRGTLIVAAADGSRESIHDIEAEISGWRKGQLAAKGSFSVRGQRVSFDAALTLPSDKQKASRWPLKALLKGDVLEATFDGHLSVSEDLQLSGETAIATPSLRRAVRAFGVPVPAADGLNASSIKGQMTWARRIVAVEQAKVTVDGNEATGNLALNLAGDRPLFDGTLAFSALDLTPYFEAVRARSFLFDRQTASWSAFDFTFPIIKHIDADLRVSAPKIALKGFGFGRGAATISMRSGKLLADIAELELHSGTASAQITANTNDLVPQYAVRGKIENFEAGHAGAALLGSTVLNGRSTLSLDLSSAGQTPAEVLRSLSGKAALVMAEGGRLTFDLKAFLGAARPGSALASGWNALTKGQTTFDQVEAQTVIRDGVLIGDRVLARSGATGISATGRVDLVEGTLDMRVATKPNVAADKPLQPDDMLGAQAVKVQGPWQGPSVRPAEAASDVAR